MGEGRDRLWKERSISFNFCFILEDKRGEVGVGRRGFFPLLGRERGEGRWVGEEAGHETRGILVIIFVLF